MQTGTTANHIKPEINWLYRQFSKLNLYVSSSPHIDPQRIESEINSIIHGLNTVNRNIHTDVIVWRNND